MTLYQHQETGRLVWMKDQPGGNWKSIPTTREDELPKTISKSAYMSWWEFSCVIDNVRYGPKFGGGHKE